MSPYRDVWIVIPAYNEASVIADVVADVRAVFPNVVCVDDGGRDDTGDRAFAAGAHVVRHPVNLGQGAAIQTGVEYARSRPGAQFFATFDADGQHPAEHIEDLLDPILEGRADVVIGSCVSRGSPLRQAAWRYFRFLTGLDVKDLTSGYRAYGRAAMALLTGDQALMQHALVGGQRSAVLGQQPGEAGAEAEHGGPAGKCCNFFTICRQIHRNRQ